MIWSGLVLVLAGAAVAVFGLGPQSQIELSAHGWHVSTRSLGLALVVVGAALSATTAIRKPKDVEIFADDAAGRPGLTSDWPKGCPFRRPLWQLLPFYC